MLKTGAEAVNKARQNKYDILMDMQMPEMDGVQATRFIRQNLESQPIIIALTANTMQADQEACLNAGMNDYICKPVRLEELTNKLEKWSLAKMESLQSVASFHSPLFKKSITPPTNCPPGVTSPPTFPNPFFPYLSFKI